MTITDLDPYDSRALDLLAQSDAYHQALYPPESNHLVDPADLQPPAVCFLGAFEGETLLGCGAFKRMDDDGRYGEIKRVFVPEAGRGRGVARALMAELERRLRAEGFPRARLETGIHQPEALALYRALGYAEREPFGAYRPDPLSLFLEKPLAVAVRVDAPPIGPLTELLMATVAAGASIGWVRPPDAAAAQAYWQRVAASAARGERLVWAVWAGERVLGSAQLVLDQPENGAHRAEVCKVMVHPEARRQGLGEALMRAVEAEAVVRGKRLLVLDTNTDSPAQRLYARLGWQLCGVMPDYAEQADGRLGPTSWMFKQLG